MAFGCIFHHFLLALVFPTAASTHLFWAFWGLWVFLPTLWVQLTNLHPKKAFHVISCVFSSWITFPPYSCSICSITNFVSRLIHSLCSALFFPLTCVWLFPWCYTLLYSIVPYVCFFVSPSSSGVFSNKHLLHFSNSYSFNLSVVITLFISKTFWSPCFPMCIMWFCLYMVLLWFLDIPSIVSRTFHGALFIMYGYIVMLLNLNFSIHGYSYAQIQAN